MVIRPTAESSGEPEIVFSQIAQQFFTFSKDLMCLVDSQGCFIQINPAWQTWLGYEESEIIGEHFLKFVHPDDHEETIAAYERVIEGESLDGFVTRYQAKDGSYRQLSWRSTRLEDGRFCAVARDIANECELLRQTEHRDQLLNIAAIAARDLMRCDNLDEQVQHVLNAVRQVSDDSCVFLYQNMPKDDGSYGSHLKLIACRSQSQSHCRENHLSSLDLSDPVFKTWREQFDHGFAVQGRMDSMSPDIQKLHQDSGIESTVLIPISVHEQFWGLIGTDSNEPREFWNDAELATLMTLGSVIAGAYARQEADELRLRALWQSQDAARQFQRSLQDSEKLRETAEELAKRAQAADKAKSAFLANMSHEIRTPMTAILGYIDMLDHPSTDETQRQEFMQTIRDSGHHLLELINNILELSSLEADELILDKVCVDLHALIGEVIQRYRTQAEQKELFLKFVTKLPIPKQLCTHAVRFQQMLSILLDNAVKFTETGGVTITVSTAQHGSETHLCLEVTDTGMGIEPKDLPRLFKPFSRGDESMTVSHGGTGLGLVLAKHIAEALNIELDVESQVGHGSTFTISVPLEADSLSQGWHETSDALESRTIDYTAVTDEMPADPEAVRILVAEDDPAVQRLIELYLKQAGFDVEISDNGEDACAALMSANRKERQHDLIIMDMQMPQMDGYEATKLLRKAGFEVPIIAVTAHAMLNDRKHCLEAGCNDYLSKPVRREALLDIIKTNLQISV